jgi:membrane protein implicated in regulation of membrane protease activity
MESEISNPLSMNTSLMWFLIGIIIMILEFIVPGFVIVFFGIGAWLVALLSLFIDMPLSIQIVLFIVSSILSLVFLRTKFSSFFQVKKSTKTNFDDEMDNVVGERVKVIQTIIPPERGKVEFHGTIWNAESEQEIFVGETVEILQKKNLVLIVKKLN